MWRAHTYRLEMKKFAGAHTYIWLKKRIPWIQIHMHRHTNTSLCHTRISWSHPHLCTRSLSTPKELQQLCPHTHLFTFPLIQWFFPSPTHSVCHSLTDLLSPPCCIELPVNKPSNPDGCEVRLWWSHWKGINRPLYLNSTVTGSCVYNKPGYHWSEEGNWTL